MKILQLFILFLVTSPSSSSACSCMFMSDSLGKIIEKFDQVFYGKAIAAKVFSQRLEYQTEKEGKSETRIIMQDYVTTTFLIKNKWKGILANADTIEITTNVNLCCTCAFDFDIGLHYYVFANNNNTSTCTPTAVADETDGLGCAYLDWFFYRDSTDNAKLTATTIENLNKSYHARNLLGSHTYVRFDIDQYDSGLIKLPETANCIATTVFQNGTYSTIIKRNDNPEWTEYPKNDRKIKLSKPGKKKPVGK